MEISRNLAIGQQEKRHTIKNTPCDPLEEFDDPKVVRIAWHWTSRNCGRLSG